jgi:UDP-N-acetylmuramyl pentapeptide phosphotransferase/UDP-N-acetylglucosamine-1-phosphate transferase
LNFFQLPIIYAILFALTFSILMNGMLMRLTKNYKKKNERSEKRLSNRNISPYGGIATSFAFFVTTMFLGKAEHDFVTIGICAVGISIIGLIDDIYNLEWKSKLIAQMVIIMYPLVELDIFINVESFLGLEMNNYLNLFISLFWVLVIINSINFIDNMDGLTVIVSGSICLLKLGYSEKKVLIEFLFISFIFYALLIGTISSSGLFSYLFAVCYLLFFIFNFLRYKKLDVLA